MRDNNEINIRLLIVQGQLCFYDFLRGYLFNNAASRKHLLVLSFNYKLKNLYELPRQLRYAITHGLFRNNYMRKLLFGKYERDGSCLFATTAERERQGRINCHRVFATITERIEHNEYFTSYPPQNPTQ